MPMGVASMSFTFRIPGARISRTGEGRGAPWTEAARPGTRLSSTRVVLPEPETPVTAVSFPLGRSTSRGCTVWSGPVDRWIFPWANRASSGSSPNAGAGCFAKKGPIWELGDFTRSSTVPSPMT